MFRLTALLLLLLGALSAAAQSGGQYEIVAHAQGSGTPATGGAYALRGILGPTDPPNLSGGAYGLDGGLQFLAADPLVAAESGPPARFAFVGPYPNPSRGLTSFRLDLARSERVRAELYTVRGRLVRTLVDGPLPIGRHEFHWRGDDATGRPVAAGIYFLRVHWQNQQFGRRIVLLPR